MPFLQQPPLKWFTGPASPPFTGGFALIGQSGCWSDYNLPDDSSGPIRPEKHLRHVLMR
jgi:hypothetical protein